MVDLVRKLTRRRVAHVAFVVVLSLSTLGALSLLAGRPALVQAAGPALGDVIIIHGYNGSTINGSSSGFDCTAEGNGNPGNVADMFSSEVYGTPHTVALGYYEQDQNCSMLSNESSAHCSYYLYAQSTTIGTNNEDIRHIGCELAWYIWDHYASAGKPVRIVAHSMGGLIAR